MKYKSEEERLWEEELKKYTKTTFKASIAFAIFGVLGSLTVAGVCIWAIVKLLV